MKVLKFGGTSVGSLTGFENIVKILSKIKETVLVVVSAASGSTNMLLKIAENRDTNLINEYLQKEKTLNDSLIIPSDFLYKYTFTGSRNEIVSIGEQISMNRLYHYVTHITHVTHLAQAVSWDLNFIIEGESLVGDPASYISAIFQTSDILITTGFIGKNKRGEVVTLNRGGGDLSAALFCSALNAEELQIWSDVPGVMTCDPRIISNAKIVPEMTYEEALELSFYGAKILHSKTVEPLVLKNIPLRVLNTFDLTCQGTLISSSKSQDARVATGLSFQRDMAIVYVSPDSKLIDNRFLMNLFDKLQGINCSMISFSKTSMSFIVHKDDLNRLTIENAHFTEGIAVISLVGENLRDTHGIAARLFETIKENVEMISQSHSQTNILVAIRETNLNSVLNSVHKTFFETL